jgi:hypothetical protein
MSVTKEKDIGKTLESNFGYTGHRRELVKMNRVSPSPNWGGVNGSNGSNE